jgi:hypothetical protein
MRGSWWLIDAGRIVLPVAARGGVSLRLPGLLLGLRNKRNPRSPEELPTYVKKSGFRWEVYQLWVERLA